MGNIETSAKNFWLRVRAGLAEMWQRFRNRMEFRSHALRAAADGRITASEKKALMALSETLGIEGADLQRVGIDAFATAYKAATRDGVVTEAEEAELLRIQDYFGVTDKMVAKTKLSLARFCLLREISEGQLPVIQVQGLGLQKKETVHWLETGELLEEKVISRELRGQTSAVSVRIARGVTYRVGASRGQVVEKKGIVSVSSGDLLLTNKRVLFRGNNKGFSTRLDKLLDAEIVGDTVRFMDSSGKPRVVKLHSDRDIDIFGAILSHTIANSNG
jgi:tellurite resistance protein